MAIYTSFLKHLNARWYTNICLERKVFCGISKLRLNDNVSIQEALNNCNVFLKVNSFFVEESNSNNYDSKFLTKQIYYDNQTSVNQHDFLDNVCYWKFISDNEAQNKKIFNVNSYFICDNIFEQHYSDFEEIKTFCFFYNFKINNEIPTEDQIFKDIESIYSSDNLLLLEQIGFLNDVDNGVCDNIKNDITIPEGYRMKFNYFLNF